MSKFAIVRVDLVQGKHSNTRIGFVTAPNAPKALMLAFAKFNVTENSEQRKLIARKVRERELSWRTCPNCMSRATKIISINTGKHTCQICDHVYDPPSPKNSGLSDVVSFLKGD